LGQAISPSGGITGAVGLGGRWQHIELGPELRVLEPLTSNDPTRVLVLTRFAARF
jgi:hypothetical protein